MFKNLLVYQIDKDFVLDQEKINELLQSKPLMPCLAQEMESVGWVELYDQPDLFSLKVNNMLFFRLGVESKVLSNLMIDKAAKDRLKEKEIVNPSRAELKEMKDIVLNELMPTALSVHKYIDACIDFDNNYLIVDAISEKKVSLVTSHLRKTLGSLPIQKLQPNVSISAALTHWVTHGLRAEEFDMLEEISLQEMKDEGGKTKMIGVGLDSKEITDLIKEAWMVNSLAFSYKEAISFKIDGNLLVFRGLKYSAEFLDQIEDEDDLLIQKKAELHLMSEYVRNLVIDFMRVIHEA